MYVHCGKQDHHRSLCLKLFPNADRQASERAPQNIAKTTEPQNVSNVVEELMVSANSQIQMQTATSMVANVLGSPLVSIRMMLESGSQRTCITENLARNLNLHLRTPQKLAVVTFGSERPKYLQYRPSEVQLFLKDGQQMILDISVANREDN